MYAVIRSGGKQERVAEGQRVRVELLGQPVGAEVALEPVLVVDGERVLATPEQLAGVSVTGTVVGEEKGPKINAMTYKSKSNQKRRWGHRQHYATLEITGDRPACKELLEVHTDALKALVGRTGKMARVVRGGTVRPGDTAESLAAKMAGGERLERFRMLNGLQPGETLTPGRRVKVLTGGRRLSSSG